MAHAESLAAAFGGVAQALHRLQEAVHEYTQEAVRETVRALQSEMEERLARVEATHSASVETSGGEEAVVGELEGRVTQLEVSLQRALEGVFPRVDALLHQLEGRSPPGLIPTSSTSCPPPSALPPEEASSSLSTPAASTPRLISKELKKLSKELSEAAKEERVEDVRTLLDGGADINYRDSDYRRTPLLWAAYKGHRDVVSLLLERGADVDAMDRDGRTALHHGCFSIERSERCVQLLICAGADLNREDNDGDTPLHIAALNGHEAAVRALVAAGARKDIKNTRGKMPYQVCSGALRRLLLP